MKKNVKKTEIAKKLKTPLYLFLAICGCFALMFKLDPKKIIVYTRHDVDILVYAIVTFAIYLFYQKFKGQNKSRMPFKVLSTMFTLLLIFGYSFDTTDGAYLVYGNAAFLIISIAKFIGLYPLIYTALNVLYDKMIACKVGEFKGSKFTDYLDKHPFKFTCIALLVCYLPYIIAFYPAVMGYDPANQIKEFMGIHNRYWDSVIMLDPTVTITNFNPIIHTLLLGGCFKLGVTIENVNLGLFLYSAIQITCMICTLAYSIKFLKREGVPNKILFFIIGVYALVPIFPFYSLSTNKDTFFTLWIMLYTIKLYELIKHKYDRKNVLAMIGISIFLFLSRNNGIYTILLSLPFCFIVKENRKATAVVLATVLLSYLGYSKVLLPTLKITPTSIREVLSIPFQQTAALIQKDEDIIEEKDKELIAKILNYETIKKEYDPELADRVKNTYNKYTTDEELKEYFAMWFKYLLKRPIIYIDATINNMYGYFYPNTVRWYLYADYNTKLEEAGFDYHFNALSGLRTALAGFGNAYQYFPLLGLYVNIGFTVWFYMYLVGCLLVNKNKKWILVLLPALSLILVCVASPANAYFRYALPFISTLPMTLALLNQNKKKSSTR